jgi:hypothetical protein
MRKQAAKRRLVLLVFSRAGRDGVGIEQAIKNLPLGISEVSWKQMKKLVLEDEREAARARGRKGVADDLAMPDEELKGLIREALRP